MLKSALLVNGVFSFLSGGIMLVHNTWLQGYFGFQNDWIFPIIGINLICFGVFVGYVSQRQLHHKGLVLLITSLDIAWVLGSLFLVALQPFGLTPSGYLLISGVAGWIGLLAYLQWKFRPKKSPYRCRGL